MSYVIMSMHLVLNGPFWTLESVLEFCDKTVGLTKPYQMFTNWGNSKVFNLFAHASMPGDSTSIELLQPPGAQIITSLVALCAVCNGVAKFSPGIANQSVHERPLTGRSKHSELAAKLITLES